MPYDAQGNFIGSASAAPPAVTKKPKYSPSGELIDYESKKNKIGPQLKAPRTTLQEIDKNLMDQLPLILGTLGGMTGPWGAAGGAALGAGIRNIGNPDKTDTAGDIIEQGTIQGLTDRLADPLVKGLKKAYGFAKSPLEHLVSSFPIHDAPTAIGDSAAAESLGMPLSVGQVTQSPVAKVLERTLAPASQREAFHAEQQGFGKGLEDSLRVKFSGRPHTGPFESSGEMFGKEAQDVIKTNYKDLSSDVDRAYNAVKFDAKANTSQIQVKVGETPSRALQANGQPVMVPQYKTVNIEGPIPIGQRTRDFATNVGAKVQVLANELPDTDFMKTKYSKLANSLKQVASGTGDSGILPWDVVKELRTNINSTAGSKVDKNRLEGGLAKLATLLGKDVEAGVASWEVKSPGAVGRLKDANELFQKQQETFTDRVKKTSLSAFDNESPDASKVFAAARKNPEAAREMMTALGPDKQRAIKGQFFEDLITKAQSNPSDALDLLDSPSHRQVFSSSDRSDLIPFFRTMRRIAPDTSQLGNVSIALRGAGIVAGGLKAGYDFAKTGELDLPEAALTGASVYFAGRQFASKVLLNPRYARTAVRLASLPPDSNESTLLRRSLLVAMRGVEATVELANGEKRQAKVTPSGKLEIQPSQE